MPWPAHGSPWIAFAAAENLPGNPALHLTEAIDSPLYRVGAGLETNGVNGVGVSVRYNGAFGETVKQNAVSASLKVGFQAGSRRSWAGEILMRKSVYFVAMLGAACIAGLPAAAAQTKGDKVAAPPAADAPQLPGGASALSETHGDWTVNCQISGTNKICSLSHQQFNKQNNQRLLAIELSSKTGDDATGTLALPFGLALAKGVSLTIDDQKLDGSLSFNTCQAVGCLVPVAFDANTTPLLKTGTTLKIDAFAADTGQAVSFSIPLNGFGGALARTAELLSN
ncbi:Invasion associated locus B family protein [Mesorhizobium opportunistum WSM2075]|uniref:Invasion associated locus B family protein n=2 Tax=Phyllobacteriaceae TaxID=69277 RepID=F7Y6Q6_MESOW|nr:Invasion associated locus B family protein [Mesorhizobium opportunistum WSM2075]